jgi:MauM/NapG family ferredoxin protein
MTSGVESDGIIGDTGRVRGIKPRLKQVRTGVQLICLGLFLWLFRLTDYTGSDTIPWAVNIWFRLDPLVGAAVTLATRTLIPLLWPCLLVIGLTLVFGRVFCGWICPLGTLVDLSGRLIRPKKPSPVSVRYLKYAVLIVVMVSAFFTVQLLGFADPFSLLVRGMTFSIDPMFNFLVTGGFDWIYLNGPAWLTRVTEPVYGVIKTLLLPYKQAVFFLSGISFFLLAAIFTLELAGRRFWCRNLCPLGALLALVSRITLFRRLPVKACKDCDLCRSDCPMDAVDDTGKVLAEECTLCMDCLAFCPRRITTVGIHGFPGPSGVDIQRRQILAAGVAGVSLPVLIRTDALSKLPDHGVIRPPGALDEPAFLAACVRCGECMKVCINNALQPLFLERGLAPMFTPVLVPRLGYCEFNCTLCTQVCPTRALHPLNLDQKHGFALGTAWFDKNRCIPYADQLPCIVCEEHCPVHDKAIKFRVVTVQDGLNQDRVLKQPYIRKELCIGCGICEHVCPVPGEAAIHVVGKALSPESSGFESLYG